MCYRQSRRGVSRQDSKKCKTIVYIANTLLHTKAFRHKSFYTHNLLHTVAFTQTLLHTDAFTDKGFYSQKLVHKDAFTYRHFYTDMFTHRHVYTQTLLHTKAFGHRYFDTQKLLHTDTFTHRRFYTQRLLHAQKLLHTDAFTHRRFYTHRHFLHTDAFTHRRFYTQRLLHTHTHTHTDAFTHRHFHTRREQGLLAMQAKGYHRFNWEEVTIDVPWLMARPWYTITSIESHKTWGGAWTRIPYIGRASVDRVVWWSPISMWTGKERKWSYPKPACINMSWGLCALGPLQPRCLAGDVCAHSNPLLATSLTNRCSCSSGRDMTQVRNRVIKTNVWHDISWILNVWLCRSMMVTCLNGTRLSDSSGWNGPLNSLNVKLPLPLAVKPCKNLWTRSLSRRQNEMAVMPSKIIVMLSRHATGHSCTAKTLAQNSKRFSSIQQSLRASDVFGATTKMSSIPWKLTT